MTKVNFLKFTKTRNYFKIFTNKSKVNQKITGKTCSENHHSEVEIKVLNEDVE